MAKVSIDLDTGEVWCRACGHRQQEPMSVPCPECGCSFHEVIYSRGDIVKKSALYGAEITVIDTMTHYMIIIHHLWNHQESVFRGGGYAEEFIQKKKSEFYSTKLEAAKAIHASRSV
jgi:hypothetical protein